MHDEIFGPVISVYVVSSWAEALAIENANPYGNAASIYTTVGGNAEWFTSRFRAGMIGVNIGIPVPREPFSFGGLYPSPSKYGDMDITGAAPSSHPRVVQRCPFTCVCVVCVCVCVCVPLLSPRS